MKMNYLVNVNIIFVEIRLEKKKNMNKSSIKIMFE